MFMCSVKYHFLPFVTKRQLSHHAVPIWPRWREVAVPILWPVPEAAVTVFSTPDDGCCDTPETCRVTLQWNNSDCILLHLVGLLFNMNKDKITHNYICYVHRDILPLLYFFFFYCIGTYIVTSTDINFLEFMETQKEHGMFLQYAITRKLRSLAAGSD